MAGYHLPLDAHPVVGNNAGLCELIGLADRQPFATYSGATIGFKGLLPEPVEFAVLVEHLRQGLAQRSGHGGVHLDLHRRASLLILSAALRRQGQVAEPAVFPETLEAGAQPIGVARVQKSLGLVCGS